MSLKKLMHRQIRKTDPDTTIGDVARLMRHYKIGSIFIEEEGRFVGIVTEGTLVRRALSGAVSFRTPVRAIMDTPLIVIDAQQSVIEANHLMHFNGIRHLGVSENGVVVGMLSVRDLVRHFASAQNGPFSDMREIIKPLTILAHRNIQTIPATASAAEAAQKMGDQKIGALMVTETAGGGGAYVGIVTEGDLVKKVIGFGRDANTTHVGAVMMQPIIEIDIAHSIEAANTLMADRGVRHLAVTEDGKVVGVLSVRDLIGMISIRDLPRFFKQKGRHDA